MAKTKRVLVVDDESSIRDTLADAFAFEGYEVLTATNGAVALDLVRAHLPDVVVLDLMMPVMSGWQFLEACATEKLCAETPVLVMSASRRLNEDASKLGFTAIIAKPFDLDVMLAAVDRLAHKRGG